MTSLQTPSLDLDHLQLPKLNLDHLLKLTDEVGIFQHAILQEPDPRWGYCTDDVSRALIVSAKAREQLQESGNSHIIDNYINFLQRAQKKDGSFRNFLGTDKKWSNKDIPGDSLGRVIHSLSIAYHLLDNSQKSRCLTMLENAFQSPEKLESIRNKAYALIGLSYLDHTKANTLKEYLAHRLAEAYLGNRKKDWLWWEDILTYDNAKMPEAMILSGYALNNQQYIKIGLESLDFLTDQIIDGDMAILIGNNNNRWLKRGAVKSQNGQQAIDASSLVEAYTTAEDMTGLDYSTQRELVFSWFLGNNTADTPIYDSSTGATKDGIWDPGTPNTKNGINPNCGAESTLAYLTARLCFN